MSRKTWRDAARPIIARVLEQTKGQSAKEVRKSLRAAYPFGPYDYHPKRIWLSEIRRQIGKPTADDFGNGTLFEDVT